MFGYENGGIYNMAASLSLITYLAFFKNSFSAPSSVGAMLISLLAALLIIQFISLLNNNAGTQTKLAAALIFTNLLFLFFFASKIQLSYPDLKRFIEVVGIFFFYSFVVSINQKYELFASPFEFFPSLSAAEEYEMGILRSTGVLNNFEFYAEYSISLIALVLPAVLSGSSKAYGQKFYYFCFAIIFIGVLSIIFSGTRSSVLLLPAVTLLTSVLLNKRLKIKVLLYGAVLASAFAIVNASAGWIDFDVFSKRSENVDLKNLTLEKILSGEEINRGGIFAYGIKKAGESHLLFGEGYFTNRSQYIKVHFDKTGDDIIPDYHNLYMSVIVIWGYLGGIIFLSLFIISLVRGYQLYFRVRQYNLFAIDILLGFNLLFTFLLINQFKIQFIRDANYFLLTLLFLVIYNAVITLLKNSTFLVPQENATKNMIIDIDVTKYANSYLTSETQF
ncbi:O-antigen ligase family protein [Dyadobacter crusticola]|uniref:O-antigen ligase family protein n=1 Tax=Dyadobacter crusticola TaxID=292407 RepID=UPI00146FB833|nr:O-antigen ligase family protein [Dyadobacter crusticola]